jgi:endonuclease/exonuclease/phosphatase family metal-dependent hydrolase
VPKPGRLSHRDCGSPREVKADIIALQEVLNLEPAEKNQTRFIAEELGLHYVFGKPAAERQWYGNAIPASFV